MIINMTPREFSGLGIKAKKKIFEQFLGHKVDQIVSGSMTNDKWGEYRIRHEEYAYSNIRVNPSKIGLTELTIYNFQTEQWQEQA